MFLLYGGTLHAGVQFIVADPPELIEEPIALEDAKLFLRVTVPDEDAPSSAG